MNENQDKVFSKTNIKYIPTYGKLPRKAYK